MITTSSTIKLPLQTKFHNAMETSQRVVKETADRDKKQITAVLDGLQRIVEVLNNLHDIMQDFNLLAQKYKAPNIVTGNIIHVSICLLVGVRCAFNFVNASIMYVK